MAQYPQEQLEKLLKFLNDEVIHDPANAGFVDKLCKLLPQKKITPTSSQDIKNIEKYLALDFAIDKEYSPCDYSFLDDFLQIKAESDFREMKRFQLGLRGHKKDFSEFCRYVVLQAELMLNFFYEEYYLDKGGIAEALSDVIKANTTTSGDKYYNPTYDVSSVEGIPFNYKLWAFAKQFNYDKSLLELAKDVRNSISHRSIKPNESLIKTLHKKLSETYGLRLKKDGSLPSFIPKELLNNSDIKKYRFEFFLQEKPFKDVEIALKILVDKIYELVNTER